MASSAFRVIADPTRRRILDLLRLEGPQRAGDIAARFPRISRPAVSRHLRRLRRSRLVRPERRGRERWYHLNPEPLADEVHGWVDLYRDLWRRRLTRLKQLAEAETSGGSPR